MDPLTHVLAGGMAAKTVHTNRRRFWVMMFLGGIVDIDVLFNGLGPWAFWLQHRGITHSLFGIVIQAIFYAAIFAKWDRGPFRERAFHYSLPLILHVLFDALTCHGVPLLSPFSFHEYSFDLVASVGLFPVVFMSIGLIWLHRHEKGGWSATQPLWAAWVVYLCFSLTGKAYAGHLAHDRGLELTTLPTVVNPFSWRAVDLDQKGRVYRYYSIDLISGKARLSRIKGVPGNAFPVQASLRSPDVQTFLHDNRWPVVRVTQNNGGWAVEWGTLLFSVKGQVRGKVIVDVDPGGHVLAARKSFSFWTPENS